MHPDTDNDDWLFTKDDSDFIKEEPSDDDDWRTKTKVKEPKVGDEGIPDQAALDRILAFRAHYCPWDNNVTVDPDVDMEEVDIKKPFERTRAPTAGHSDLPFRNQETYTGEASDENIQNTEADRTYVHPGKSSGSRFTPVDGPTGSATKQKPDNEDKSGYESETSSGPIPTPKVKNKTIRIKVVCKRSAIPSTQASNTFSVSDARSTAATSSAASKTSANSSSRSAKGAAIQRKSSAASDGGSVNSLGPALRNGLGPLTLDTPDNGGFLPHARASHADASTGTATAPPPTANEPQLGSPMVDVVMTTPGDVPSKSEKPEGSPAVTDGNGTEPEEAGGAAINIATTTTNAPAQEPFGDEKVESEDLSVPSTPTASEFEPDQTDGGGYDSDSEPEPKPKPKKKSRKQRTAPSTTARPSTSTPTSGPYRCVIPIWRRARGGKPATSAAAAATSSTTTTTTTTTQGKGEAKNGGKRKAESKAAKPEGRGYEEEDDGPPKKKQKKTIKLKIRPS